MNPWESLSVEVREFEELFYYSHPELGAMRRKIFIGAPNYRIAHERARELGLRNWIYWRNPDSGRGYRNALLLLDGVGISLEDRALFQNYGWDIRPVSEGVPA